MTEIIANDTIKIIKIHGYSGNFKINKSDLLTILYIDSNIMEKIKCDRKAIVEFKCCVGELKQKNDLLCVLSDCVHRCVINGYCGLCSTPVEIFNNGNGKIESSKTSMYAMVHSNKNVVISEDEAVKIAVKDCVNLLNKRKLCLLVDLDATILHTTDKQVSPNIKEIFHYQVQSEQKKSVCVNLHTKFRPYLKDFLTKMNKYFEMHIYTFGTKSYAANIAKIIDREGKIFGKRIISKDDSFDSLKKCANLKSLFPRGDNMVCIIDDRVDVWNNAPNCLHVQPYIFFPDTGDINDPHKNRKELSGIENTDNKEIVDDIVDNDRYLISLAEILKNIHRKYYQEFDKLLQNNSLNEIVTRNNIPDTKKIMQEIRSSVFRGCRISFSGILPMNQNLIHNFEYQILTNLGGTYMSNVLLPSHDSDSETDKTGFTTHLICKSVGTEKMKQVVNYIQKINEMISEKSESLPKNIHRVHLLKYDWLWQSYFFWRNLGVNDFLLIRDLQQLPTPSGYSEMQFDENCKQNSRKRIASETFENELKKSRSDENENNNSENSIDLSELDGLDDESSDLTDEDEEEADSEEDDNEHNESNESCLNECGKEDGNLYDFVEFSEEDLRELDGISDFSEEEILDETDGIESLESHRDENEYKSLKEGLQELNELLDGSSESNHEEITKSQNLLPQCPESEKCIDETSDINENNQSEYDNVPNYKNQKCKSRHKI